MRLKFIFIFLFSTSYFFYGQRDIIEIKGNIVDYDDSLKRIPELKVMLIFNDTLSIVTNADSLGNYSFNISRNFTKAYKTNIIAYQDYQAAKKLFPPNKECPYFNNYWGYLQTRQKLEFNSDANVFILNLKMTPVKVELRFPSVNFKKNSTEFSKCSFDDPDTSIICIKKVLAENPSVIIELQVHSWNEQHMNSLSKERAKLVIDKLIEFGIDSKRIKTTIWLDKKPLIRLDMIEKAKTVEEKERLECKNRRITYRIISWDYK